MNKKISVAEKESFETIGILGHGEIGSTIERICKESGFKVLIRELKFDEIKNNKIDYLHINIPEINNKKFIKIVVKTIEEVKPKLTIINSSITPGTTRKIFKETGLPIVHSPVIGLHPNLYDSVKNIFPKIIGPIDEKSLNLARSHFKKVGLKVEVNDNPENTETAKLLDLVYYAWNIIFCKWVKEVADDLGLNFEQIYTKHNQIYNEGYGRLFPNAVRPVLIPWPGPIGGHCTIPDTKLFHAIYKNRFTKFILDENKKYEKESSDTGKERTLFLSLRSKLLSGTKKAKIK